MNRKKSLMPLARCVALSLLAVIAWGAVAPQAAEPDSNLVLILDGSGSMWGRIKGNEPKVAAAKKVTRELLAGVPPSVRVGFVSYGHRRRGDCTDIETLAPLGTAPAEIADRVQGIMPRGKTPITEALRHGAGLLGGDDRPSTLVLVSDGIETCKGDPCALAAELRKKGVNVVIHTVGFGVGRRAAEQLQCIAKAGGGNYYDARDAAGLRSSLFAVRKAVIEKKLPPEPKVAAVAPPKTKSKVIRLLGPGTIKLKPAPWVTMPPYEWYAADPETAEQKASARRRGQLKVRSGEYQIVWHQSQHYSTDVPLTEVVSVPAGKTVEVPIDTGLEIVVPKGMKAPYFWSLKTPGTKEAFARFKNMLGPQVVPAGTYELGWYQNQHYAPRLRLGRLVIEPGKLNRYVVGSGFQVARAKWVPKRPYEVSLSTADGKPVGGWRRLDGPLVAPPGTYRVTYRQSQHYHTPVAWGEITVPKRGFARIDINSGVAFKPQPDAKPPYQAIFVALDDGNREYVWKGKSRGKWEGIPLPPGRYRLDWREEQHGTDRITLLDEFTIEPGALVEFEM